MRCKFGGYPEPFVTMRFKEKLMSNASNIAEKKLITDAMKYFGVYKCHAENKFGSTNHSIELKLAGEKDSLFPVTSQFWRLKRVLTVHIVCETYIEYFLESFCAIFCFLLCTVRAELNP